jgi:transposase-like protein
MVVSINGQRMYLWRAVDSEGEVLDMLVQRGRDKAAAMKLLRKLLKRNALPPHLIVTDKLRSYGAALRRSLERLGAITSQPVLGGLHPPILQNLIFGTDRSNAT